MHLKFKGRKKIDKNQFSKTKCFKKIQKHTKTITNEQIKLQMSSMKQTKNNPWQQKNTGDIEVLAVLFVYHNINNYPAKKM